MEQVFSVAMRKLLRKSIIHAISKEILIVPSSETQHYSVYFIFKINNLIKKTVLCIGKFLTPEFSVLLHILAGLGNSNK